METASTSNGSVFARRQPLGILSNGRGAQSWYTTDRRDDA
jgi:hypothetical protein